MSEEINIDEVKKAFEDQEIFNDDEKKEIKVKRNKSITKSVEFAKLFLIAHDTFNNYSYLMNEEQRERLKVFSKKAEELRKLIEDLDSTEINTYFPEMRVKKAIENREEMNNLITTFFRVFMEDEE